MKPCDIVEGELAPKYAAPIVKQKQAEACTECRKIKLLKIRQCMCREMWTEEDSLQRGKRARTRICKAALACKLFVFVERSCRNVKRCRIARWRYCCNDWQGGAFTVNAAIRHCCPTDHSRVLSQRSQSRGDRQRVQGWDSPFHLHCPMRAH